LAQLNFRGNGALAPIAAGIRDFMKPRLSRTRLRALFVPLVAVLAVATAVPAALAARVGVLSNKYATETAADFNARITGHTFTGIETGTAIPTLDSLTNNYDVLLVFEDSTYFNAPAVGNLVAAFANSGGGVVLGAFYEQDRTDAPPGVSPHGWGALEKLDPNTTDGVGTPYAPRTLDTKSMLRHPLTSGVSSLTSAKFAGGNSAKPGTIVVAYWSQPNARGERDPAIAFRMTGSACVIQLAMAPNYAVIGVAGTDFSGDFHRAWQNAFNFAAAGCRPAYAFDPGGDAANVPTLSEWGLVLTVLLLGLAGAGALARRAHEPSRKTGSTRR
jgi:hypothetical protein